MFCVLLLFLRVPEKKENAAGKGKGKNESTQKDLTSVQVRD